MKTEIRNSERVRGRVIWRWPGILAFAVLAACFAGRAEARLGEKIKVIEARYGAPVETLPPNHSWEEIYAYRVGDYVVTVSFVGGRSQCERYTKQKKGVLFADEELKTLLDANADGKVWESFEGKIKTGWLRKDGKAMAFYLPLQTPPALWVLSAEYKRMVESSRETTTSKGLERF
ncbi:MAG: hypothetical protein PHV34_18630 [Verrucomicrobiae bacterium]|nr:hypothetical protein [Verrucomicrobiae bacterium]